MIRNYVLLISYKQSVNCNRKLKDDRNIVHINLVVAFILGDAALLSGFFANTNTVR